MTDKTFPVVLGICLDAEALWINKIPQGEYRPVLLSQGAYAINEGLDPLLAVLQRRAIPASFFAPGITAERYPDALRQIRDAGHEIGSHGMNHISATGLGRAREREELLGGIDAVERVIGTRPTTWRSPSWEFTADTFDLMQEAGVAASCSFQDRARPYLHPAPDGTKPVVELPVHWHLADAPFFLFGGLPGRNVRPATEAEQVWREEFDGLYQTRPGSYFHLTLHVQLIGHPGRMHMLARVLDHMLEQPNVRFTTCAALAQDVLQAHG